MLHLNVIVTMGVLVILTGIALVGVQIMESGSDQISDESFKLIGAEAGATKFQVETTFPGVPMIALGMILLIAGTYLSRE
jgi:ribose/xylose/arabinose/galactoside ABC-type transport system permease subunit